MIRHLNFRQERKLSKNLCIFVSRNILCLYCFKIFQGNIFFLLYRTEKFRKWNVQCMSSEIFSTLLCDSKNFSLNGSFSKASEPASSQFQQHLYSLEISDAINKGTGRDSFQCVALLFLTFFFWWGANCKLLHVLKVLLKNYHQHFECV